jgi:ABC-type branched-subunit amino acid transport system ATPase component
MASVSFDGVEKAYGSTKVIHGVGFEIHDGEFMDLVGPSGAGSRRYSACWPGSRRSTAEPLRSMARW